MGQLTSIKVHQPRIYHQEYLMKMGKLQKHE